MKEEDIYKTAFFVATSYKDDYKTLYNVQLLEDSIEAQIVLMKRACKYIGVKRYRMGDLPVLFRKGVKIWDILDFHVDIDDARILLIPSEEIFNAEYYNLNPFNSRIKKGAFTEEMIMKLIDTL